MLDKSELPASVLKGSKAKGLSEPTMAASVSITYKQMPEGVAIWDRLRDIIASRVGQVFYKREDDGSLTPSSTGKPIQSDLIDSVAMALVKAGDIEESDSPLETLRRAEWHICEQIAEMSDEDATEWVLDRLDRRFYPL